MFLPKGVATSHWLKHYPTLKNVVAALWKQKHRKQFYAFVVALLMWKYFAVCDDSAVEVGGEENRQELQADWRCFSMPSPRGITSRFIHQVKCAWQS